MNTYFPGDIIKIIEFYQDRETLYWNPIRETVGLLIEEIDNDLIQILVDGRKETCDINQRSYMKYRVEIINDAQV